MTITDLLDAARAIWGDERATLEQLVVLMGVVYGDVCRQARSVQEGKPLDEQQLKKELGNVIFSTIRWCDDLGYDPQECIALAQKAQRTYAGKRLSRT